LYTISLEAIWSYTALLPLAIGLTLLISVLALVGGSGLGLLLAKARLSKMLLARALSMSYVEVFRNIPVIILLYFIFFSVAQLGIRINGMWSTVLALTLNSSAYFAEIFRSGYISIDNGQYDAARALGMNKIITEIKVVLPQVMIAIIPPFSNQFIGIIIGSSLAAVIGVPELGDWMMSTGSSSFRYLESFIVAAIIYIILCQSVAFAASIIELKAARWKRR